ncbi:hypothetical protein DXH78_10675 [Undibacter mobilis]|uniref:Uncharacterized protein n=2 Tax=Undibacter mobilis TaxID=2292256 RepID=A0A371BBN2_9BRAD|nr:hypothetical protein DXH78_10675 [Undibacter mobilis]
MVYVASQYRDRIGLMERQMVALTYGNAPTAAKTVATTDTQAPAKSFFRRFLEAMMEARMKQAEREIRLYTRLEYPATKAQ